MFFRHIAICVLTLSAIPGELFAQSNDQSRKTLHLELNTLTDADAACRLTFVAENSTETMIDQAVFETVVFDNSGSVMMLSLFDFRDLPSGRPRVRQFDVPGVPCSSIGRVLINGTNTCTTDGVESTLCDVSLSLSSRIAVELIG